MPWARVARALSLVQDAPAAIEHNVGAPQCSALRRESCSLCLRPCYPRLRGLWASKETELRPWARVASLEMDSPWTSEKLCL